MAKPCSKCGGPRHYTGSRWRCSPCFNAWQSARRATLSPEQRAKDNAVRNAGRHRWSDEQRAIQNARAQAWREANREQHRRVTRELYWANPERARATKLAEYRRNPEAFYARNLVRKARLNDAVCEHGAGCVSAAFLAALYAGRCLYCDRPAEHADHFDPLALGGLHCRDNLVPACGPCNTSKSASDPWAWIESRIA